MKPNFFIIGAMKSGTTSVHSYLRPHPDISMSEPKEINFFSNPKFWKKGFQWYEKHFTEDRKIRGEASTSYTVFPEIPDVPRRMSEYAPDAKILYVTRDPVDRLVSHYMHNRSVGRESRPFAELLLEIQNGHLSRYIHQSQYYYQLSQYLEYFSPSQILVITMEMLKLAPKQSLKTIFEHLQIEYQHPTGVNLTKKHNESTTRRMERNWWVNLTFPTWLHNHPRLPWIYKAPFYRLAKLFGKSVQRPNLSEEDIELLSDVFRDDVKQLKAHTQSDFQEWRTFRDLATAKSSR